MPLGSTFRSAFSPNAAPRHPDRRQSPRYDMAGGVYLLQDGAEPSKIGMVRDISLGGAYVMSDEDFPADKVLRMQFKIGADFEMSGHVCRKDRTGFALLFDQEESQADAAEN